MKVLAKLSATRVILAPAFFFHCVVGQTSHTVTTGLQGSFFDPASLSAGLNDTVTFVFSGAVHTVTQSTFENPCVALPGGFNSGPAGTNNTQIPPPIWTLLITNVSAPIWYFCQVSRPQSHCGAGMVGVINPPNISMVQQFQASAKAVSGTPVPTFTVALQGSGALATAAPSTPPYTLPTASSVTVTVSASTTSSTTPAATSRSASSKNVGVIVGGTLGGVLGGIVLIILLAICWRIYSNGNLTPARREPPPMVTQELGGYQYRQRPHTVMSADDPETLSPSKSVNTVRYLRSDGNMSAIASTSSPLMPMQQQFDSRNSNPLVPVRRPTVGPRPANPGHQRNGSLSAVEAPRNVDTSDVASTSSRSDRATAHAGLDIQSLAEEVAAVLRSTSGNASALKQGQSRLIITNDDSSQVRMASTSGEGGSERGTVPRDNMTTESPPPHYSSAGGGQRNW